MIYIQRVTEKGMRKITLAFCVLTLGSSTVYAAATADLKTGDATAGKTKSALCGTCHGVDGNSINPIWPNLAGQHASYIVQQLKGFQSEARSETSMSPMAAPLSEQDMLDLGAYFETQTAKIGTASQASLELGQTIYRGGIQGVALSACISCHGPKGEGNPAAKYPRVSGQHAAYNLKQLKDYKTGARKAEGNAVMMRDITLKMSEEQMQAVTNYMQGLY
jgi:cytochrome c553